MKYRKLGKSTITVSAIGFGCMGMSEFYGSTENTNKDAGKKLIRYGYDNGITFFDTAEMYGSGDSEIILGTAVKSFRDKVIIATKCGIQRNPGLQLVINNNRDYIKNACNGSLRRLGVSTIDVYYLHRYNPEVPIEDSMNTMQELIKEGKIRYVGLSEVSSEIIERAHRVLGDKLVAVQSEYSLINRREAEEVLPICRKLGISFVPFSPLARGLLSGKLRDPQSFIAAEEFDFRGMLPQFSSENLAHNLQFVDALAELAKTLHCSAAQLSLAWLLAQGDYIIPIPGTTNQTYLKENIDAADIELTQDNLEAIKKIIAKHSIRGGRMPEGTF